MKVELLYSDGCPNWRQALEELAEVLRAQGVNEEVQIVRVGSGEEARRLGFPVLAGSSLPVNYRYPEIEFPQGARTQHGVVVAPGPIDSYGLHMLEAVQCLIERRAGGETGVAAVQCIEGEAIWSFLESTPWAQEAL